MSPSHTLIYNALSRAEGYLARITAEVERLAVLLAPTPKPTATNEARPEEAARQEEKRA